jgi:hypothetical protein
MLPPPPPRCLRHSANAATVLPLPPPLSCHRRCRSAAAAAAALLPRCPPPPPPTPSLRCHRRPHAADAATAMPTVAAPLLQRHQRRHQLEEKNAYQHEPRLAQRASEGPMQDTEIWFYPRTVIKIEQPNRPVFCYFFCYNRYHHEFSVIFFDNRFIIMNVWSFFMVSTMPCRWLLPKKMAVIFL